MDYPNNEYKQKNRPFFDDEALEREFSDPQLALDYDGEIVFYVLFFSLLHILVVV